ncbi:MAG: Ig-like domain-containing protein [Lachnospiraceae bacterium]|nr:Ig-like domain-containing protein [Lachnospiraceae bacterium]
MFKQKVFKRVLPMLLVISMMFQTVSGTALAAEIPDAELLNSQTEAEEIAVGENSDDETVAEDSAVEETEESEVVNEEDVDVEESSDEVVSDETPSYDETALPKAEIRLDYESISRYLSGYPSYGHRAYEFDNITGAIVTDYHSVKDTNISDTVKGILDSAYAVDVSVAGELKYTWQKAGANGSYTDMTDPAVPSAVGSYRLVISLDATDTYAAANPVSIDLVVKKSVVTAEVDNTYFESGKTAADVIKSITSIDFYVNDDYLENVSTNEAGNFVYEGKTYIKEVSLKVKNADTGSVLNAADLLKLGVNYIIVVEASLKDEVKDNYELGENASRLVPSGSVVTSIAITDKAGGAFDPREGIVAKTYDGKPVDAATEVESKYTAKVVLASNNGQEIANAKIETSWCIYDYNYDTYRYEYMEIDTPVDAGTYYYKLSYVDEEKAYGSAVEYITVKIEKANIVVVPKLSTTNFYSGISAKEVLENVTYDVYRVDADKKVGTTAETIDAYFWGVTSDGYSYEPVFVVQKGVTTGETTTWSNITGATTGSSTAINKEADASYRVVFNYSLKAYYSNGNNAGTKDDANSTNYKVVELEELAAGEADKCAQVITLDAGKVAEINVDAILKDDRAGESILKPIVKTYDGSGLYTSMSDYKKAVVSTTGETPSKVAENTDSRLKYQWQSVSFYMDGNTPVETGHSNTNFNEIDICVAPYQAGVYRLVITFDDASKEYYAAPAYVYYTVKRQDVVVTLGGAPEVYADGFNTISSFINNIQYENADSKATYVTMGFYPATVTEDAAGNATATKGANAIEDIAIEDIFDWDYFYVEMKAANGNWDECDDWSEPFREGTEYRLGFRRNYSYLGYNFNRKLDNYNNEVKRNYYDNETVSITVKHTDGKELTITVGDITNNTKVYDGKPFDVNAIKSLVTIKSGETVVTNSVNAKYLFWDYQDDRYIPIESAVHGGYYTLCIEVEADDTYRGASKEVFDTEFIIERKTITVTPVIKNDVKAGTYISRYYSDYSEIIENYTVDGLVPGDENAIEDVYWSVCKGNDYNEYSGYLKSTEEYYVMAYVAFAEEYFNYERDYSAVVRVVGFKPVRAAARVEADSEYGLVDSAELVNGSFVHTITTKKAIPYDSYENGNIVIVRLYKPNELDLSNTDMQNIKKNFDNTGVGENSNYYYYNDYIEVTLDASDNSKKEFTILWDTDYTETYVFDFSKSLLQADFSKAVAPKSIAFNGVTTKMVVGDDQDLDVKLTKNQVNDIILLEYSVDKSDVLHINENTGKVTALSKGTATVTVYPCRYVDGVKTPITGKGVKTAKVKITVSDVAAPKISGLTYKNGNVSVKYKQPANGYRREIYVLSGKKSVANFEDEIAKVNNGNYSAFVYSGYVAATSEVKDKKDIVTLGRNMTLEPSTQYTLYLRNVSRLRDLGDGCQVAVSHAGAVKTFKTTKPQATAIRAYFSKNAVQSEDDATDWYVDFKDKSAQLSVDAKFDARYIDSAADAGNYIWRTLSLSGNEKKVYEAPKLNYSIGQKWNSKKGEYEYIKSNDIASINNSGKLTFKGVGTVVVRVEDTVSGCTYRLWVYISASPDSVTGKKAKVQPGTTMYLSDLLEYKQGKSKVVNYQYYYADLKTDAKSNDGFKIEKIYYEDDRGDVYTDYEITALKPNAKLDITVTDKTVEANGGRPATVKLTSSAVEAVKKLKAYDVFDNKFSISFTYPTDSYNFKYEVKDARGNVVSSSLAERDSVDYDSKTKQYIYTYTFSSARGIKMLSNYTVTVTAYCGDYASKATTLKVKTTNIPASYYDYGDVDAYGGITISYTKYYQGYTGTSSNNLSSYNTELNSGNVYALEATPQNSLARLKKTDTLTWKSTNTKVATIKANAGSYTANLKALKAGETTIVVTSKITKKVIARYKITVNPVGEADDYYGEY